MDKKLQELVSLIHYRRVERRTCGSCSAAHVETSKDDQLEGGTTNNAL